MQKKVKILLKSPPSLVHEQMTKVPASKERVNVFDLHLALILTTLPVGLKI